MCLFIYPSVCLSVIHFIWKSIYPSSYISISPFVRLFLFCCLCCCCLICFVLFCFCLFVVVVVVCLFFFYLTPSLFLSPRPSGCSFTAALHSWHVVARPRALFPPFSSYLPPLHPPPPPSPVALALLKSSIPSASKLNTAIKENARRSYNRLRHARAGHDTFLWSRAQPVAMAIWKSRSHTRRDAR